MTVAAYADLAHSIRARRPRPAARLGGGGGGYRAGVAVGGQRGGRFVPLGGAPRPLRLRGRGGTVGASRPTPGVRSPLLSNAPAPAEIHTPIGDREELLDRHG